MRRRATLAAVLLAGCGGDPERRSPSYAERLDAVCADSPRGSPRARNSAARRDLLPRYEAIDPPPAEREFHRRFVQSIRDQIALTGRGLDALERGDETAARSAGDELRRVIADRRRLFRGKRRKFEHCGRTRVRAPG